MNYSSPANVSKCTNENITPTIAKEVAKFINESRSNKSPEADLISGNILKELPSRAIGMFTIILKAALRIQFFPTSWKRAHIIMLQSQKKTHLPSSYRPISLLPLMSKLLEKIISRRTKILINENKLIPPHQFGFRYKFATIEQIHRMTYTITLAIESKEYCTVLFLNIQKAFTKCGRKGSYLKSNKIFLCPFTNYLNTT